MRNALVLGLALGFLIAVVPSVAQAGGLSLNTAKRAEIDDCPTAGGDGGAATRSDLEGPAQYLMRVTDEDVWVCFGVLDGGVQNTCPTGGERFSKGNMLLLSVPGSGRGLSCRSTGATGDIHFTQAY